MEIHDNRPLCAVCGSLVATEEDRPNAVSPSEMIGDNSACGLDEWRQADSCICRWCMDYAGDDESRRARVMQEWGRCLYSAVDLRTFRETELKREEAALARWNGQAAKLRTRSEGVTAS